MPAKRVLIGFGVDVDAVAGWLGSYGGEDSPLDISRGMYAGEVGTPRLLKLFSKYGIKTTWFIPGHSLETFPEQMKAVRDAGHELGLHGYSHENPVAMTLQQQKDILDHTYNLLTEFNNGIPPKGSVAPWWETSKEGTDILLDKGIEYDHSSMAHDSQAYYMRDADSWTKIDYTANAATWMQPLKKGNETGLVCIPANWYLDDLPPMMLVIQHLYLIDTAAFKANDITSVGSLNQARTPMDGSIPGTLNSYGKTRSLIAIANDQCISQERFIEWVNTHENVHWVPMIEMARDFRKKNSPAPNAKMPVGLKQEI
ncbi:Peptidoglycan deacetylase [Psilocybe cubensis]|uniref:Peptidoglycan deacetylase n=1 Tax=Psilocybe cubensis TaxID=181762 RepID=A0ACB8GV65_PSICU|nr:Peptidoglycan deacetylase [Psilocybe cubensis]KAH9479262.1 Peptidoglycan deacetylase [Psilocybe cubensis]